MFFYLINSILFIQRTNICLHKFTKLIIRMQRIRSSSIPKLNNISRPRKYLCNKIQILLWIKMLRVFLQSLISLANFFLLIVSLTDFKRKRIILILTFINVIFSFLFLIHSNIYYNIICIFFYAGSCFGVSKYQFIVLAE